MARSKESPAQEFQDDEDESDSGSDDSGDEVFKSPDKVVSAHYHRRQIGDLVGK